MTRYPTLHSDSIDVRLWKRVDKTEYCWNWTGRNRTPKGYGSMRWNRVQILVHRISWELANGPIPDGMCVLHRCDNPACVRPDHLFLGTRMDNNVDMSNKGRRRYGVLTGESNGSSKLSCEQVDFIRASHKPHDKQFGTTPLARQFGVSVSQIQVIVHGRAWKHVT